MEDVELGTLGSSFVREILLKDIKISNYFLYKFAGIIRKMNKNVFNLITASAKKRLLFQILHLSVNKKGFQDKKILDKSLSHSALASFAGLSRETVSESSRNLNQKDIFQLRNLVKLSWMLLKLLETFMKK